MKKLFFLYVWLNLTRIAELRKEDLVKHIRKRTIQTGRLFFSSSLRCSVYYFFIPYKKMMNEEHSERNAFFMRKKTYFYKKYQK